jgi:hypothetical protein
VIGDFERPARRRAAQDRALSRYLRTHVAPYSTRYAPRLREHPVDSVAALSALPFERLDDIDDATDFVLRPTAERIAASGDRALRAKLWRARRARRLSTLNRHVLEPAYKPVHWHLAGNRVPIGYSAEDVELLGALGRTQLELAGVGGLDVLVGLAPAGPEPGFWQLALGARQAGVSALFLSPDDVAPDAVARLRPNVLAGRAPDLRNVLERGRAAGLSFGGLHTLLVIGAPIDAPTRARLAELGGDASSPAAVVVAWAPPGVRALWAECRDGVDVHTWPSAEVLELIDPVTSAPVGPGGDGELVYTPLAWKGTVILRLRTGVYGTLDDAPCVACGRTSPRLRLVPFLPPFADVLDHHPEVALWQAELRHVDGGEELIVFLAPTRDDHPGRLLRELDRQLAVTQFVVLDAPTLADRLRKHDDARVVDLRG